VTSLRFLVSRRLVKVDDPLVLLQRDNWDDYSFKATFHATLLLPDGTRRTLDTVKIVTRAQDSGPTPMPEGLFERLDDEYCSLGQAYSYYERLAGLGKDIYDPLLRGLRDMVFLPAVKAEFISTHGVEASLLRFDTAVNALEQAPVLFGKEISAASGTAMAFTYRFPEADAEILFRFGDMPELPTRLSVIIGYNGAGKTRLLAKLAMLAVADRRESELPTFAQENGTYVGQSPTFGSVIAISYSAFDDFAVPGKGKSQNAQIEREQAGQGRVSARNYRYCGLRKVGAAGALLRSLKSLDELADEFGHALTLANEKDRATTLADAIAPLMAEPSFRLTFEMTDTAMTADGWEAGFSRLSTGHKIVLNIVVHLCAHLERKSLVLIDEPEMHLHPPLLAALLRATNIALERHDSFAILATHSPVVLQEVPARSVHVLERVLGSIKVDTPEIETFAENVGLLTKHVFHLDSSDTDYQGTLRQLARTRSIDEIAALFDGGLSSQGLSLVTSLQHAEGWSQ
jgi:predicted ATPase